MITEEENCKITRDGTEEGEREALPTVCVRSTRSDRLARFT